ncbi:MAG: hypothetical protein EBR28_09160 [Planctomycetia bacterium]|nr:hypothetical protein [Planctomycetia bacterium]
MTTAHDCLKAGDLAAATAAATAAVKAAPKSLEDRWLLAELLILGGQFDRADAQFDTMMTLEPRVAVAAAPIRQLLRAEAARRQFFDEGRVPELLDGAGQQVRDRLEAFVLLRAGRPADAGAVAARAEIARPALGGVVVIGGVERPFADFRDLDDVTAEVFEVLTQTGKYYWIEMARIGSVEFEPPARPLDLVWRKAGARGLRRHRASTGRVRHAHERRRRLATRPPHRVDRRGERRRGGRRPPLLCAGRGRRNRHDGRGEPPVRHCHRPGPVTRTRAYPYGKRPQHHPRRSLHECIRHRHAARG